MSVEGFKKVREEIDFLIDEIKHSIKKKSIIESSKNINEVNNLLVKLKSLSSGNLQEKIIQNRIYQLESLARQIDEISLKRKAGKKEDGNIALKCNWNDRNYKSPCSVEAYEQNILQGRAWCSSYLCKCRDFSAEVNIDHHPCYESIALKEMYFGAGWDHKGDRNQPRHIHSVKEGRMAILTTRMPWTEEKDRIIIGCLFIKDIHDDPEEETKIFGDKQKSIEVDYNAIKVNFWDFYKNPEAENLILWASGLFRYITDETVLNILKGIEAQYKQIPKDLTGITPLIKYYEGLVNK